ncbi:MAG TPA: single-stranded-DNA-specific exonuclease RecJ, partial [Spirochaetales bacterium]|nr:single-stranded-DNA-specific exonuclease RecJ [Spirochaetales bacterium]
MKWNKREAPASLIREIAAKYKLDLLYAAVLTRRGIVKPEELLFYLEKDLRFLHNPFLFRDMEDAVDRVLLAIDEQEKILIFGDRDTDGVSATVLLYEALKKLQADVSWDVPCEEEKYGLSIESIDRFADEFGSLIITV